MAHRQFPHSRKKQTPYTASHWEQLQWLRLLCAVLLFLAVFAGKQIYPETVRAVGKDVISVLGNTTDFEAVFSDLGASLRTDNEIWHGFEEFCVEVFGADTAITSNVTVPTNTMLPLPPRLPAAGLASQDNKIDFSQFNSPPSATQELPNETPIPAVGTVLTVAELKTKALPAGYTMDELSFGTLETVTPVFGCLNSEFGYRDHPINGTYCFHGGADISASAGDPIAAFADGMVEYVGEDDSYGLYLQLDHGNGIKSFYAHCQSICVKKGQQVTAGETIAKIGSTGTATGPHLHLELKCGNLRVNPAYYIEFMDEA